MNFVFAWFACHIHIGELEAHKVYFHSNIICSQRFIMKCTSVCILKMKHLALYSIRNRSNFVIFQYWQNHSLSQLFKKAFSFWRKDMFVVKDDDDSDNRCKCVVHQVGKHLCLSRFWRTFAHPWRSKAEIWTGPLLLTSRFLLVHSRLGSKIRFLSLWIRQEVQ